MKPRRWMKNILIESTNTPLEMPWSRRVRADQVAAKPRILGAMG